jgi:hypothetical protein
VFTCRSTVIFNQNAAAHRESWRQRHSRLRQSLVCDRNKQKPQDFSDERTRAQMIGN